MSGQTAQGTGAGSGKGCSDRLRRVYYTIRWIFLGIWMAGALVLMGAGYFRGESDWYTYPLTCGVLPCVVLAIIWAIEINRFRGITEAVDQATVSFSMSTKKCSRCGRTVPPDSHAGQHCPHCGVYWSA